MNTKTYEEQRRDRLSEAITDYLTDEQATARRCYEDMLAEVESWIAYHACNMKKAEELKALMLGERFYDKELTEKWGVPVPKMPGRY